MTELATGTIKFVVRSGSLPLAGAGIYTSIDRMTWYYRGYTDSVGTLMVLGLPAGTNYYIVSKSGYHIVNGSTNVPANGGIEVDIYMTKSLSVAENNMVGSLTVISEPDGAWVYIDEMCQETPSPVTIVDIPEGDHMVRLVKDGYEDFIALVNIMRGQVATMTAQLVPA